MSQSPGDMSSRVAAVANRLRLVQMDFADDSPDVRRDQLSEEIERATASMVPEQRRVFLQELQERFPTWDSNVDVRPVADDAGARSKTDERELKDPSFLVARLVELAPRLTEPQRRAVVERLKEAGLGGESKHGWPDAAAEALRAKLASSSLDPVRTLELAAELADFGARLDQLAWNTWRTINPRSRVRRPGELLKTMARFVQGDQDIGRGQVKQDIEALRRLIAALISSVNQAGRQFAQKHVEKYAPTEIEASARPGKKMLEAIEVACWRKYIELAGQMDAASIEGELLLAIASYAEPLIIGTGR